LAAVFSIFSTPLVFTKRWLLLIAKEQVKSFVSSRCPNTLVPQTILFVNPHDDDDDASQPFDSSSLL